MNDNIEKVHVEVDCKFNKEAELRFNINNLLKNEIVLMKKSASLYKNLELEIPKKEELIDKYTRRITIFLTFLEMFFSSFCFPKIFWILRMIFLIPLIATELIIATKIRMYLIEKYRNNILEKIKNVDLELKKNISDISLLRKLLLNSKLNVSNDKNSRKIYTYSFDDSKLVKRIYEDEETDTCNQNINYGTKRKTKKLNKDKYNIS